MIQKIEDLIREQIDVDEIFVTSRAGGHFSIRVVSKDFTGKSLLQKQRMVMLPLKQVMSGDQAPVHAIDEIITLTQA